MIAVNKFSSRLGERVRLVVIHTSEGARTVESLAAFLNTPGVNASYHGAVDDQRYESFVDYSNAAWALRDGNQESDNLCLCAFAGWSREEWLRHPRMLELAAAWIAERCVARGLPVRQLYDGEVGAAMQEDRHPGGWTDHDGYTKGTGDGDHWDVGENFPFQQVGQRAHKLAQLITANPARRTTSEEQIMHIITPPGAAGGKQQWPTQRISFGFDPKGGWGGNVVLNLHFGFPGGWVHEAKWWVRSGAGVGEVNKAHSPVPVNFSQVGGQERHGGLGWQLTPPERADELEILFSAPGGVHVFPVYER